MRIISGRLRGKRIKIPKYINVRPTTDQSKEAIFNILANRYDLNEIKVLDLFSGTGSISFEFSSRGVKTVYSVDKSYNSIKFIKKFSDENNLKYYTDLLSTLRKKLSISNGSLLILEHPENINLKEQEDVIETRKYGSCFFSFLNL